MTTELKIIEVPEESALALFTTTNGLDPLLEEVFKEVRSFIPDLSTKKGRDAIASLAHKVSRSKTAIDGVGKDLVSKLKEQPKLVDAERKRVRDMLDDLRDEARKPLTDWENAEKQRVDNIQSRIIAFNSCEFTGDESSADIQKHIDWLEAEEIKGNFDEFEAQAIVVRDDAVASAKRRLERALDQEAQDAELERLRLESIERDKAEREAQIAREATEAAQRKFEQEAEAKRGEVEKAAQAERDEAERKRLEAEQLANAERQAAEKRELELRYQAERAEREKVEAQRKADQAEANAKAEVQRQAEHERQEAIKREANKAHKAKINNEALQGFIQAGLSESDAKTAVKAIALHLIPNVTISY